MARCTRARLLLLILIAGALAPGPALAETPTIALTSPPERSFVHAGDPIIAIVSHDEGLGYVSMTTDCGDSVQKGSPPFEWAIPATTEPGERKLQVYAYDADGSRIDGDDVLVYMASGLEAGCDSRDDCAAAEACLPEGICAPEDYGAGALGSPCTGPEECVGARCERIHGDDLCTRTCDDDFPCPGDLACNGDSLCAPADAGGCRVSVGTRQSPSLALPLLLVALGFLLRLPRAERRR